MSVAFYTNDETSFKQLEEEFNLKAKYMYGNAKVPQMLFFIMTSYDLEFTYSKLLSYKPHLQKYIIENIFARFVYQGFRNPALDDLIKHKVFPLDTKESADLVLDTLMMDLRLEELEALCNQVLDKDQQLSCPHYYLASSAFLRGEFELAESQFEAGLKLERKLTKNSQSTILEGSCLFYILLLIKQDPIRNKNKIDRCKKKNHFDYCAARLDLLSAFSGFVINSDQAEFRQSTKKLFKDFDHACKSDWIFYSLYLYVLYFVDDAVLEDYKKIADNKAHLNQLPGIAIKLLVDTFSGFNPDLVKSLKLPEHIAKQNLPSLTEVFEKKAVWETKLELLKQHFGLGSSDVQLSQGQRFVWVLDVGKKQLLLKKQQLLKSGNWSVGQNYSLNAYTNVSNAEFLLSPNEQKILELFDDYYEYDSDDDDLEDDFTPVEKAILMLCGAKNVYADYHAEKRIDLIHTKPSLELKKSREGFYKIKLSHDFDRPQVFLERLTKDSFAVVECGNNLSKIKSIIGKSGIEIPIEAEREIKGLLKAAEVDLEIVSELDYEDLPVIPSANKLYALVYFDAYNFNLKLELLINPANDGINLLSPVNGRELIKIVKNNGEKFYCKRDLVKEKSLLDSCLTELEITNSTVEFQGIDSCLDIISALENYKKNNSESIDIEWKQGEKLKVLDRQGFNSLSIKVESKNNWFEYSGEIKLNEDRFININEILSGIETGEGNYVKLNTGEFLGLTEDLKKSLQKLKYISDSSENKLHKLAMSSVLDLEKAGAAVGKDTAWQEYIDKLKTFNKLKIKLPKNFNAQLRDYQYEGFVWLSRLAYLGAGACLADDMGLGKTVQTIALMASKAKAKPCLVIAPTSVVSNWQAELDKFTTGLNSIILSELGAQNDKRKELISSLKPGDILLCSYGLLQTQIDLLKEVEFSMVILDESQAIKNPLTKRAQAAKLLKADFRLVLSGTPIENNLTELWSQFDFINPGLLSSLKNFQGKFANAIEVNKDKVAQASLKQLIQPYILRRIKNEVLQDLPPKIEQTIRIEFDPDEAAFYEVLRQKAIEKLENSQEDNIGKRKLQILAEMSKLRRACCHPSLVDAPGEYLGSKNKEFLELVTNLKSNIHKALVFSQYTSYLKLLAQSLDLMELNYLYLDGSTPAKKRKELVKEFQTGNADLFLLSLKAGGSGLNLTEADYVIHLDPWWNPAVEDQATDRAHRIGQNKTVNVYRLIMKSTIEEKILKLHDTKRELADELLSDADMTAKLSDKELLEMMKG
jgi:SNF2 family DNA or RNA helicase